MNKQELRKVNKAFLDAIEQRWPWVHVSEDPETDELAKVYSARRGWFCIHSYSSAGKYGFRATLVFRVPINDVSDLMSTGFELVTGLEVGVNHPHLAMGIAGYSDYSSGKYKIIDLSDLGDPGQLDDAAYGKIEQRIKDCSQELMARRIKVMEEEYDNLQLHIAMRKTFATMLSDFNKGEPSKVTAVTSRKRHQPKDPIL